MLTRKTLSALLVLVTSGWIYAWHRGHIGRWQADDAGLYRHRAELREIHHTIDAGDPDGWADTFTDDGNFNGTIGRAALMESRRRAGPSNTPRRFQSGDHSDRRRRSQLALRVYRRSAGSAREDQLVFRYDDTLVKPSKGWRFKTKMRSSDTTIRSRTQQ